ncbi:MAG: hypothetical protein ACHP9T_15135 [Caulobacterales bacterium]|jgi:hypothetical protein
MKNFIALPILVAAASFGWASASIAGATVGAPAPLLGAGLPGLAIMAVAGAGYVAMRLRRRGKD